MTRQDTFTTTVDAAAAFERRYGPSYYDYGPSLADVADEPEPFADRAAREAACSGTVHADGMDCLCTCCPECEIGVIVTTRYDASCNAYEGGCSERCGFLL